MALTPLRWIGMAIAGCLLMSVLVLEIAGPSTRWWDARYGPAASVRRPDGTRVDSIQVRLSSTASYWRNQAYTLAVRYRMMRILDSANRVMAASRDTGKVRLFIDGAIPRATAVVIDSTVRRAQAAKVSGPVRTGVDVFFAFDTARFERGVMRGPVYGVDARYGLPQATGERCRVYARMGGMPSAAAGVRDLQSQAAVEHLLGPCAYYAAFGQPGPRVREWLIAGGWRYTIDGSWTSTTWRSTRLSQRDQSIFKGPSLALYWLNPRTGGFRCSKGEADQCELASRSFPAVRGSARAVGDATVGTNVGSRRWIQSGLGDRGSELLADVVRTIGREKFEAFWTSPDSVHVAFEKATGRRWTAYLSGWMKEKYGTIESGPRLSGFALGSGALIVVLSIGAALWFTVNRRYA